jgi:hypothetical protein
MDYVRNCDSYINTPSSQTYRNLPSLDKRKKFWNRRFSFVNTELLDDIMRWVSQTSATYFPTIILLPLQQCLPAHNSLGISCFSTPHSAYPFSITDPNNNYNTSTEDEICIINSSKNCLYSN